MKVTKYYDFSKDIEDYSNDKVIIEMSIEDFISLQTSLEVAGLESNFLKERFSELLKATNNYETKVIE